MDRVIDEIILLALCIALLAITPSTYAIVGLLAAVVVVCVCEIAPVRAVRYACLGAYLICAMFIAELLVPLPLVVYQCVAQRSRVMRIVWIIVPVFACVRYGTPTMGFVMMLCVVAAVLSVRSARNMAERKHMRRIRDGLREQLNEAEGEVTRACAEARAAGNGGEGAGRGAASPSILQGLTDREQTITGLIAEGLDNKDIASELYLSEGTVRNHISCILQKTHLKNRTQIAIMYLTELRS